MLNVKDQGPSPAQRSRPSQLTADLGPGADPGVLARRRARRAGRAQGPELRVPDLPYAGRAVELSGGTIEVRELGSGPTLLFVHGLLVDGRVWDPLVEQLAGDYRCVVPTLPLGSHRRAMAAEADQSPEGIAALLEELTIVLGLSEVTVIASDSGGAITQLWMDAGQSRVRSVVLTPCDCFSNFFPPAFKPYQWIAHMPRLAAPVLGLARFRLVRQLPNVYGGITHRRIDDAVLRSWLAPGQADRGVFRDTVRFLASASARRLTAAEERLRDYERPVLFAWTPEQAFLPARHARRLAEILPDARVVQIRDSGAFISLEQPAALAAAIREFAPAPT